MNASIRLLAAVRYPPYLHFTPNGTSQFELQVSGRFDSFAETGPNSSSPVGRAWSFDLRVFGTSAEVLARQLEEGAIVRVGAEFAAYADEHENPCVCLRVIEVMKPDLTHLGVQGRALERNPHPQGGTLLEGAVNEVRLSGRLGRAVGLRGEGDSSFAWVSLVSLQSGKTVWLDLSAEGVVARDLATLGKGDRLDLEGRLGYGARRPISSEEGAVGPSGQNSRFPQA